MFEIDPLMVEIATNPRAFTYVSQCRPDLRIVIGDARLKLAEEPAARFDLLAVDAFSSDAIPLHLLTREAFETYFRTLSKEGVLLVHISNRFLNLEPVVSAIAKDLGIASRVVRYIPMDEEISEGLSYNASIWVALTRDEDSMTRFTESTGRSGDWVPVPEDKAVKGWTDSFASILPVFKGI